MKVQSFKNVFIMAKVLVLMVVSMSCRGAPLSKGRQLEIDALVRMLRTRGSFVSDKLSVELLPRRGESLIATQDISKGEELVVLYPNCLWSDQWAREHYPEWEAFDFLPWEWLVTSVAVETRLPPERQTWTELVVPAPCESGLDATEDEKRELNALGGGLGSGNDLTLLFDKLKRNGLAEEYGMTLSTVKWAMCRRMSRSFASPAGGPIGRDSFFAPIIDHANHDPNSNIGVFWDLRRQAEVAIALRDIPAGREVLNKYNRDKTNVHFLQMYGFWIPNNPSDHFPLPLQTLSSLNPAVRLLLPHALKRPPYSAGETYTGHLKLTATGLDDGDVAATRLLAEGAREGGKVDSYFYSRIHERQADWSPSIENEFQSVYMLYESTKAQMERVFNITKFSEFPEVEVKLKARVRRQTGFHRALAEYLLASSKILKWWVQLIGDSWNDVQELAKRRKKLN